LIDVHVLAPEAAPTVNHSITVRDAAGQWTPAFVALRQAMGLPPQPG
jgi:hypothetical protein